MPDELAIVKEMLPFLIPLVILQFVLMIIALIDLVKREHITGTAKIVWLLVIIFVNLFGPIIYLAIGRKERPDASD